MEDISNSVFLDFFSSILHPFFILSTSLLVKFLSNFCFAFAVIGSRLLGAPEGNQTCRVQPKQHLSDTTVGQETEELSQPPAEEIRNQNSPSSKLGQQGHWASFICSDLRSQWVHNFFVEMYVFFTSVMEPFFSSVWDSEKTY